MPGQVAAYMRWLFLLLMASCATPLAVQMDVSPTQGEWPLTVEATCTANKEARMSWIPVQECGSSCTFTFDKPGEYLITCTAHTNYENVSVQELITVQKQPAPVKTMVVLGDSLTEGYGVSPGEAWPSVVADTLGATLENNARSGATSGEIIQSVEADLAIIWVGANDAAQFISPNTFENNLQQIYDNTDAQFTIFMTIPDVSQLALARKADEVTGFPISTLARGYVEEFNARIRMVNASIIDMNSFNFSDDMISSDGIHPSKKGHEAIAEQVLEELPELFPKYEW